MKPTKKIVFNVIAALTLAALSFAEVYNLRPFGTGAYFALLLMSESAVYVIAPIYFLSQAIFCTLSPQLWGYAAITLLGVILRLIFMRLKKDMPLWTLLILPVGFCGFIYPALLGMETVLGIVLSALLSTLFALVAHGFAKRVARSHACGLNEPEWASGCTLLCVLSLALARPIGGVFCVVYLVAAFITLCAFACFGVGGGFACALACGAGLSLHTLSSEPLACLVVAAGVATVFNGGGKYFRAAGCVLGFVIALYLLGSGDAFELLSFAIGCAAYICLPQKALKKVRGFFLPPSREEILPKFYDYHKREGARIFSIAADIFSRTRAVLSVRPSAVPDVGAYARFLYDTVCGSCECRGDCKVCRTDNMRSLMEGALEGGQVVVAGLPQPLLSECRSISRIVAAASLQVENYQRDKQKAQAIEAAAEFMGETFDGMEGIMRFLALSYGGPSAFDFEGAEKLCKELGYGDSQCLSALCVVGNKVEAELVSLPGYLDDTAVLAALKKQYGTSFSKVGCETFGGYEIRQYVSGAALDVIFGVSSLKKNGETVSGDTYSFTRTGEGGFMMAISDGMGSGESARSVSETAISLVESYYRAGFDSALVTSCVNRFLTMSKGESFSAMDVTVIDLRTGGADIIKIGCPPTLVKRGASVAAYGGDSLPLGAIENIEPFTLSVSLNADDMVVMTSDGVMDALGEERIKTILAQTDTLSPQAVTAAVISEAVKVTGHKPSDDMTVLCGRLFVRN